MSLLAVEAEPGFVVFIWIGAVLVGLAILFAQLRLFTIAQTLHEILAELRKPPKAVPFDNKKPAVEERNEQP